jgi:hypothetical protein
MARWVFLLRLVLDKKTNKKGRKIAPNMSVGDKYLSNLFIVKYITH